MTTEGKRRRAGIRRLKNEAPRILSEVREEEAEYVVTHRGEPVAVIRPWSEDDELQDRAEGVRAFVTSIDELAGRVAVLAGRRTAAAAVSAQRR